MGFMTLAIKTGFLSDPDIWIESVQGDTLINLFHKVVKISSQIEVVQQQNHTNQKL